MSKRIVEQAILDLAGPVPNECYPDAHIRENYGTYIKVEFSRDISVCIYKCESDEAPAHTIIFERSFNLNFPKGNEFTSYILNRIINNIANYTK